MYVDYVNMLLCTACFVAVYSAGDTARQIKPSATALAVLGYALGVFSRRYLVIDAELLVSSALGASRRMWVGCLVGLR